MSDERINRQEIELEELSDGENVDVQPQQLALVPRVIYRRESMPQVWDLEEIWDEYEVEYVYMLVRQAGEVIFVGEDEVAQHDQDEEIEVAPMGAGYRQYRSLEIVNEIGGNQNEADVQLVRRVQSVPTFIDIPTENEPENREEIRAEDDQLQRTFNWVFGTCLSLLILRVLYEFL